MTTVKLTYKPDRLVDFNKTGSYYIDSDYAEILQELAAMRGQKAVIESIITLP